MALGKAQKAVLCRLGHKALRAHGAIGRTLSALRRKGLAKKSRYSKGLVVITKKGRGRISAACGSYL